MVSTYSYYCNVQIKFIQRTSLNKIDGVILGPVSTITNVRTLQELTTGASIYPDFETVLIGHFWKFRLVSGRQSRITSSRLSKKNGHQGRGGLPELRFEEPGASSAAVFAFDPPSHYRFGDDPTIPDPYESKNVQVK